MGLDRIEVEHGITPESLTGFVRIRVITPDHGNVIGNCPAAAARRVAMQLLTAAARAEYEQDLARGASNQMSPDAVSPLLHLVRSAETERMESAGDPDA